MTEPQRGRWLTEIERALSPGATVVIVAVSASLLLATIGSVLAWRSYEERVARETDQVRAEAIEAADATSQFFAARLAALESVAQMPAMVEEDVENMAPLLEAAAIQQLGFSGGVGWVDRSGMLRAHSTINEVPVDLSDRAFVQHVLSQGSPSVGESVIGRVTEEVLIVIAVPTYTGELVNGVLLGSLRADRFDAKVPALAPSRFETRIVGREGRIIIADGHVGSLAEPSNPGLLEGPSSFVGPGLMGEPDRVVGFAPVEEAGWTVVLAQDRRVLLAGARGRVLGEVAILGLLGLLTIGAAVMAARRMNASHRQMLEGARNLDALETLSESLSSAPETRDVAYSALEVFGRVFDAGLVSIGLVDRDDQMRVHRIADHLDFADADSPDEVVPLPTSTLLTDAFESVEPMVLSAVDLAARYPDLEIRPGVTGAVARRFVGRNAKGSVGLFVRGPFPPPTSELELFTTMVPLLGDAFGRASAAENEKFASRAFQQALLPRDTIGAEVNLQRAVRYIAAADDVEVGGDWYDLWMIDEDHVGGVVGDVVGRGVKAAAAMGQLRSALRATVATSNSPDEALARLDDLTGQITGSPSATVILGSFDTRSRTVRLASAGHLPPMHATREGARVMYEVKGTPVGFLSQPTRRKTVDLSLGLEDTLVLYSDGLVERRGETIDEGIERLRAALAANRHLGVEALAELLLEHCLEPNNQDDVALIVLRPVGPHPSHFTTTAPIDDFAGLLASLRSWLETNGHGPEITDLVLSRVEAALDAVIRCTAEDTSGDMVVEVANDAGLDVVLQYRRSTFGAETDRIYRTILRQWQNGELTRSGPRLQFMVDAGSTGRDHRPIVE